MQFFVHFFPPACAFYIMKLCWRIYPNLPPLLIWLHELVAQNRLRKVGNVCAVAPRLQSLFFINCLGEASQPLLTRESLHNILKSLGVDDLYKVLYIRVVADIVIDRSQLNDLADECDVSLSPKVLVADDCLSDCFGLIFGGSELQ